MFSSAFFKHFRVLVNNIYFPPLYFAIKKDTKITPILVGCFCMWLVMKAFSQCFDMRTDNTEVFGDLYSFPHSHFRFYSHYEVQKIANKCSGDIFLQLTFNLEMDFWNRSFVPSVMWESVKELKMNSWQFRYFRNIWISFNTQMVQATYLV